MSDPSGPVRVAVLIDSLGQGGAEQSLMAVLPPLREQGIDAQMLLVRSVSPERERELADAGVPVRIIGPAANPLALARRVRPVLRSERPDLLHVTLFEPIVGGGLGALGTGVPVLATQASTPPETGRGSVVDTSGHRRKVQVALALEGLALRRLVAHVHAVTPGVRTAVHQRFGVPLDRISVAERGRDPERFRPPTAAERAAARADLGVGEDDEVLVALGRHDPAKGYGELIEAIALLADRPRLVLLLAGREGTATDDLRAAIARHRLEDRVRLLGDRPDPERILAAGDLFVLSSRREGTSGAAIEAMATGLPIVSTRLAGLAGIVHDGEQARTVPVADAPALAAAIAEVLDDPDLAARLADGGRATFTGRFTLDRSVAALGDLYRRVAATGR